MKFKIKWPFMRRSEHEAVRQQNTFLKSALHEANKELQRHRKFVAGIRSGQVDVVGALDRIAAKEKQKNG